MANYQHWGVQQPGNLLEPNNQFPPEFCAGSNLSMGIASHDKKGVVFDGVGGWADRRCNERYIFVCEVQREWRVRRGVAVAPAGGSVQAQ